MSADVKAIKNTSNSHPAEPESGLDQWAHKDVKDSSNLPSTEPRVDLISALEKLLNMTVFYLL